MERERRGLRRSGIPTAESSSSHGTGRRRRRSGHATQTHVRQSSMYSDRPRWVRGGRADNLAAGEAAAEGRTNELGPILADMFKTLSLNDSSPTLDHSDGSHERQEFEEYLKEHTFDNLEDALVFLCSGKRAAHVRAEAAEDEALSQQSSPDRYEDCPVPTLEQHQSLAAEGQYSKVSKKEIAQNGKKGMTEEVKVAFEKYMEGKDHPEDHKYELDELQHQCSSVENYYNIFHHFNFTVRMKVSGSTDWTSVLFFAELKEILRQKMYFCCPLEPYKNGLCYACKSQGIDDLKHPVIGAFDRGSPDMVFPYMYDSDSSD